MTWLLVFNIAEIQTSENPRAFHQNNGLGFLSWEEIFKKRLKNFSPRIFEIWSFFLFLKIKGLWWDNYTTEKTKILDRPSVCQSVPLLLFRGGKSCLFMAQSIAYDPRTWTKERFFGTGPGPCSWVFLSGLSDIKIISSYVKSSLALASFLVSFSRSKIRLSYLPRKNFHNFFIGKVF